MKKLFNCNEKESFKEVAKEAATIIKCGYEHYPSVHRLERSILEAYSLKTGADFKDLRRAARHIRLHADIDQRAKFYCSLISKLIGEKISPQLYDEVNDDLILLNKKGLCKSLRYEEDQAERRGICNPLQKGAMPIPY